MGPVTAVDDGGSKPAPNEPPGGLLFWAAMSVGAATVAFGTRTLWDLQRRHVANVGRWFLGAALVLDLAVIPVAAALAALVRRACPPRAWPAVRAGLLAAAACLAVGLPLALDLGGNPSNPSARPRAYGWGLTATLVVIAVITAAAARAGLGSPASRHDGPEPEPDSKVGHQGIEP